MTVNIGTRHCRSDAVTLSSSPLLPSLPGPPLRLDTVVSALAPNMPTHHPPPALSSELPPDSFLLSAFPGVSLQAQCLDLTREQTLAPLSSLGTPRGFALCNLPHGPWLRIPCGRQRDADWASAFLNRWQVSALFLSVEV